MAGRLIVDRATVGDFFNEQEASRLFQDGGNHGVGFPEFGAHVYNRSTVGLFQLPVIE